MYWSELVDPWIEALLFHVGQHVRLHDADIDAAQVHDVGDVPQRAFAEDREHAQGLTVIQHRRKVGGDPHIGPVHATRDDADSAGVGLRRTVGNRCRLGHRDRADAEEGEHEKKQRSSWKHVQPLSEHWRVL